MALEPVYKPVELSSPTESSQPTKQSNIWDNYREKIKRGEVITRGRAIKDIKEQVGHWNGKLVSLEIPQVTSSVVGVVSVFWAILVFMIGSFVIGDIASCTLPLWLLMGVPAGVMLASGFIGNIVYSVKINNYYSAQLNEKKITKLKAEVEAK